MLRTRKERNEAALADRINRSRLSTPPRDPTGEWHRRLAALSQEKDIDFDALVEDWDYRAAVLEYDANSSRAEAERLAFEAVAEFHNSSQGVLFR